MDEAEFLRRMVAAKPELMSLWDGWTSHSYPNPGFSGSPYATGRGTLKTYEWELAYLQQLGLTKSLPIFITETGWVHSQGQSVQSRLASPETVGSFLQAAAMGAWKDSRIIAITPFIFNYQGEPFDHFSWKKLGSGEFYPLYYSYKDIQKVSGHPKQHEQYILSSSILPSELVANSTYTLSVGIKNTGQGILNQNDGYQLALIGEKSGFGFFPQPVPTLEPGDKDTITIFLKTPQKAGTYRVELILEHYGQSIHLESTDLRVVPPPEVKIHAQLGWKKTDDANDVTILVYGSRETLLHKFTGLTMRRGEVSVKGLTNIVPGEKYRIVILVPHYLPRQTVASIGSKVTNIRAKRFLPLDINNDGKFTLADILLLLETPPRVILMRFISL